MENIIITTNNTSKFKKRAKMLARSINNVKKQGVEVAVHEPIEGKMFWTGIED